jgi:hypothetical protein
MTRIVLYIIFALLVPYFLVVKVTVDFARILSSSPDSHAQLLLQLLEFSYSGTKGTRLKEWFELCRFPWVGIGKFLWIGTGVIRPPRTGFDDWVGESGDDRNKVVSRGCGR